MTYAQIVEMAEESSLPVTYHHFAEGDSPEPPFLIFLLPNEQSFFADDAQYLRMAELDFELYTDKKDPALERKIEEILQEHEINYEKSETWIETEKMYEVIYEMEVLYE